MDHGWTRECLELRKSPLLTQPKRADIHSYVASTPPRGLFIEALAVVRL
jgi:hypothetical protein